MCAKSLSKCFDQACSIEISGSVNGNGCDTKVPLNSVLHFKEIAMKLEDIRVLIAKGESDILEFKKSTAQLKSAGETLCAFLNNKGGVVFIGVSDKGEIIGQQVTEKTRREIGGMLAKLAPEHNVEVSYIEINNDKEVIVLRAKPYTDLKPYTFNGKAYIRIESSTHPMSRDQYQRMNLNYMHQHRSWEKGIIEDAVLENLDAEEIMRTMTEGIANKRIPADRVTNKPKIVLKRLGLLKNDKITNAAMILFGKEPAFWLPQCSIRLARFRGIDKSEFIDSKIVDGNVFQLINAAMQFADLYLPVSSKFGTGKIERIDEPLFPIDALREVFANAIGHRNYAQYKATLSFAIYENRLEVWSPGLPPDGVTFDNIKILHESILRNRLITKVLYYRKLFESWGRGIQKIIDLCIQAGHPEPEFIERTGGVCVILRSKQSIGAPIIYAEGFRDILNFRLTSRQKEIYNIIKESKRAALSKIMDKLIHKVAKRTVQRDLSDLKKLGLITLKGGARGAVWEIIAP
ncbi:MAG: putative DNA binding domain-containing protein [Gammaproteobacteria bacterium]